MADTDDTLKTRIRPLNSTKRATPGRVVIYLMSRDMRVADNHALLAAQKHASAKKLPLLTIFVLFNTPAKGRAKEHIQFLVDGLADVRAELSDHQIPFVMKVGNMAQEAAEVASALDADAMYTDFSPLRGPRSARKKLSEQLECPLFEVDTHNLIPVWVASDKQEVGARTLRPKIQRLIATYLHEPESIATHEYQFEPQDIPTSATDSDIEAVIDSYPANHTDITRFTSGQTAGLKALQRFLDQRFVSYGERRSDPSEDAQSELSPYLHYGHLSTLRITLAVTELLASKQLEPSVLSSQSMPRSTDTKQPLLNSADVLIEEMIIRKELSDNFCFYNSQYDSLNAIPEWARRSLDKHDSDPREFTYSLSEFEAGKTHDQAWNAAQLQLIRTGKIHNYMRMYWAKKILEWSPSANDALQTAITLNDFYSIDGGDPNGYVGILWSVGGVHDRPWGERPVYGVIRSMVYGGLKRKFNIESYNQKYQ